MHQSEGHPPAIPPGNHNAQHPDEHYQPLKNAIPGWLGNASATRREALKKSAAQLPETLKPTPSEQHAVMKSLGAAHIAAQSEVDKSLEHLQDAATFAEPLLKAELKNCFDLDLDVRNTFVRLYIPATTPWFPIRTGARVWTVSLLDAALHNFEDKETYDNAFETESTFTTAPSATGQFETLPAIKAKLGISAFTQLCRRLDIGAKYKASLEDNLGYSDPMVATVLRRKLDISEKTAMKAALQWARINRDVSETNVRLVDALLDGMKGIHINSAPVLCHDVTMLCAPLTGIVVFAPDLYLSRNMAGVVAYVPDDPEHPFKEYASSLEMVVELTRQLRSKDYQQFFSRFVNHEQRGFFFSTLNSRLSEIKWHPHEPGNALPAWRETPVERPDLQTALVPFHDELWQHLHQAKLNKVFFDARVIAVPTVWVDQRARWAFWDSVVNIISTIAQTAALIVAPFVPVLGEAMMAYMAYQMLDEAFEGIVEWGQGRTTEAFEHLMGTVESMIQLGMFAVGGAIASTEFRNVLPREVVAFIDRFKPVKLANGETRYWEPDLERYKHPARPEADSQPSELGLHSYRDKQLLPLNDGHFSVKEHEVPGQYRIEHPTRPDAYQPVVRHNGDGAWHTELEQPMEWDGETALRRIGPTVETFTPAERESILQVSGTGEDAVRKMHVNQEKVPPLLADSIQRFKIDQQLQRFIDQLDSDVAEEFLRADQATQLQLLSEHGRWPSNQRLRLIDRKGDLLWQSSTDESLPLTQLRQDRLIGGDLLKTLLSLLDEGQIKALLAEPFTATPPLDIRSQTLRKQLVGLAKTHRSALFESRYRALQHVDDPLAQQLKAYNPELPASITRELLDTATGSELLLISDGQLPPRQRELMQLAGQEVRMTRAYEGLELDSVNNPDSDSLALHSLKLLPGWSGDVRIEIRDGRYEGLVLDSIGREDAPEHKVLVRGDNGRYQPYDDRGQELHSFTDFYSSLLYALPDSERQSLNLQIGHGQRLKAAIQNRTLEREELRTVIYEAPIQPPTVDTLRLLGTDGYPRLEIAPRLEGVPPRTLEEDIRALYPRVPQQEIVSLAQNMRANPSGSRTEMRRLQDEYLQLQNDLHAWANHPPAVHPETGAAFTPIEKRAEIQNRRLARDALLKAWRRETPTAIDQYGILSNHALRISQPVQGELPVMSADFSHITSLAIEGRTTTDGFNSFLQHFGRLQRLEARGFKLPSLPQALTSMPSLRELRLPDCGVSLTTPTESVLASLPQLTILDLQGNSLGLPPDLHAMPSLRYVNLSNTGIYSVPPDILDHPRLISAQLDGNNLTQIPDGFFDLAGSLSDGYTFADNQHLSAATRERVKTYYQHTGRNFAIQPERADLQRATALFPDLDAEQATQLLYRLPGTLAEGRAQLSLWENELGVLQLELNQWVNQASALVPESGERLPVDEQTRELNARRSFADQLEQFWRSRTEVGRNFELAATADFSGDLPALSANFEHVARMAISGNRNLSAPLPFLERFPNLRSLRLNRFKLDTLALEDIPLPRLIELELVDCGLKLKPESQTALPFPDLHRLDLHNNPLGTFPDLTLWPELTYLDLSNCGLTNIPDELASQPKLRTAVLSGNEITDIPDSLFELPAERSDDIYLSDNKLSPATREKIKAYYRTHRIDFDVSAAEQDVALAQKLFPDVDQQEASDLIYNLPGTLGDGRAQLIRWQAELEKMKRDLTLWAREIPTSHPVTGQVLVADELEAQFTARTEFKLALEAFWQQRSRDVGTAREDFFSAELKFFGEMPRLTADFGHVNSLRLTGNASVRDIGAFVERFPNLLALNLKAIKLDEVPSFLNHLQDLKELRLNNCAVTLTTVGQDILASLPTLKLLDLSHNKTLTLAPDLARLPAMLDVSLINTGLTALPEGLAEHPRLQSLHLDNNRIIDLPQAFFSLPPERSNGVYLSGNELSATTRERIKTHYVAHGRDFGIKPTTTDIVMARKLFPQLDESAASNLIYHLPGTLQAGTAQLVKWEAELARLISDLFAWRDRVPLNNPATGRSWTAEETAPELAARQQFGEQLEKLWRDRHPGNSALRVNTFAAEPMFSGELPKLTADFSHITQLNIQGNQHLNVPDGFLRSFTGLKHLELQGFTMGWIPKALESMSSLKRLMLSKCQIRLDRAGQTTLSTLSGLQSLDLFSNALGATPDVSALKALRFVDLVSTGIDSVPAGLEKLPHLETALLSDNNITELPGDLQRYTNRGMDVSANDLSPTSRERVKAVFESTGEDFGVVAEEADMDLARSLYPSLPSISANKLIYRLPGTLAEGRLELLRRQAEMTSLLADLDAWAKAAPRDPVTRALLEGETAARENFSRNRFKDELEARLRRYPTSEMDSVFKCSLSFDGELPPLAGRFDYINQLHLSSTSTAPPQLNRLVELFPKLDHVLIQDYPLGEIPSAIFQLDSLTQLSLPNCNLKLMQPAVESLASLSRLNFLNLSNNPLGNVPDLSKLDKVQILDLGNTGLKAVPQGVLTLPALKYVDLSNNFITALPQEFPLHPGDNVTGFELAGNKLDADSQLRLQTYNEARQMRLFEEQTSRVSLNPPQRGRESSNWRTPMQW